LPLRSDSSSESGWFDGWEWPGATLGSECSSTVGSVTNRSGAIAGTRQVDTALAPIRVTNVQETNHTPRLTTLHSIRRWEMKSNRHANVLRASAIQRVGARVPPRVGLPL
jgi:hypothetical protein